MVFKKSVNFNFIYYSECLSMYFCHNRTRKADEKMLFAGLQMCDREDWNESPGPPLLLHPVLLAPVLKLPVLLASPLPPPLLQGRDRGWAREADGTPLQGLHVEAGVR